jgi:DNA-binding CsgD family transcriptional regulator
VEGNSIDQIIGRDAELASLAAFLDRLPLRPAAMLIEGEAGIGKTTLWKWAVAQAQERGYRVLSCRAVESETAFSFAALGDIFGGVLDDVLPHLPDPQRRALEVALLRAEAGGRSPDQRTVSVAVLGAIRQLSQSGPVVLAADDVQWLDHPSARVLEFSIRRLTDGPVGVLASVRAEDGGRVPLGLNRALPPGDLERVRPGRLSLGALQHLLQSRLNRPFPRPTLLRIHRASGGNPLFALEVAGAVVEKGMSSGPGQALPMPATLRDLVHLRLTRVSARTRRLLLAVSALSRPTVNLIERAVEGRGSPAKDLDRAAEAGVIEMSDDQIRFVHPLVASVIYADASARERRILHRRLAEVVPDPEERARHLALGTDEPDAGVAGTLEEAARTARSRGAPDAAAELLEVAGRTTPASRREDVWRRTIDAARYHQAAGESSRAQTLLEQVIAAASGPAQARALLELATVKHDSEGPRKCLPLLERALDQAGDHPALRSDIERDMAHNLLMMGNLVGASRHVRSAVELAATLDDPVTLAATRNAELMIRVRMDGITPALLRNARAFTKAAASTAGLDGDHTSLESARQSLALLLTDIGAFDEARDIYLDEYRGVIERGDDFLRHYLGWCLARVEYRAGNFLEAAKYADESYAASFGLEGLRCEGLYSRAEAAAVLGQVEVARTSAEEGVALADRLGFVLSALRNRSVLGFLELSQGNLTGAHRHLGPAVDVIRTMGLGEPAYLPCFPDEIEALIGMGELDAAEPLLAFLEERGRTLDRAWALAAGARGRGLLHAARGEPSEALAALDGALEEHGRLVQPFELARTLLVRGQVERRMRKWGAARSSLEEALEIFTRLGAPLWIEKARAELRRIGGRPPSPGGLTPTEERVAELAAAGRSNREIAESLFMSVNTVEANLSRVYHKLRVRSRTELGSRIVGREASSGGS